MDSIMDKIHSFSKDLEQELSRSYNGRHSHRNLTDGSISFNVEFRNEEFSASEMTIMSSEKLVDLEMLDLKQVKMILSNQNFVAHSKERKM